MADLDLKEQIAKLLKAVQEQTLKLDRICGAVAAVDKKLGALDARRPANRHEGHGQLGRNLVVATPPCAGCVSAAPRGAPPTPARRPTVIFELDKRAPTKRSMLGSAADAFDNDVAATSLHLGTLCKVVPASSEAPHFPVLWSFAAPRLDSSAHTMCSMEGGDIHTYGIRGAEVPLLREDLFPGAPAPTEVSIIQSLTLFVVPELDTKARTRCMIKGYVEASSALRTKLVLHPALWPSFIGDIRIHNGSKSAFWTRKIAIVATNLCPLLSLGTGSTADGTLDIKCTCSTAELRPLPWPSFECSPVWTSLVRQVTSLAQRGFNIILLEFYLDGFLLVLVQGSGLISGFHIEKLWDPSGLISSVWHFQRLDGFINYTKILPIVLFGPSFLNDQVAHGSAPKPSESAITNIDAMLPILDFTSAPSVDFDFGSLGISIVPVPQMLDGIHVTTSADPSEAMEPQSTGILCSPRPPAMPPEYYDKCILLPLGMQGNLSNSPNGIIETELCNLRVIWYLGHALLRIKEWWLDIQCLQLANAFFEASFGPEQYVIEHCFASLCHKFTVAIVFKCFYTHISYEKFPEIGNQLTCKWRAHSWLGNILVQIATNQARAVCCFWGTSDHVEKLSCYYWLFNRHISKNFLKVTLGSKLVCTSEHGSYQLWQSHLRRLSSWIPVDWAENTPKLIGRAATGRLYESDLDHYSSALNMSKRPEHMFGILLPPALCSFRNSSMPCSCMSIHQYSPEGMGPGGIYRTSFAASLYIGRHQVNYDKDLGDSSPYGVHQILLGTIYQQPLPWDPGGNFPSAWGQAARKGGENVMGPSSTGTTNGPAQRPRRLAKPNWTGGATKRRGRLQGQASKN